MQVTGVQDKPLATDSFFISTETFLRETLKTTKLMVKVFTDTKAGKHTKEIGQMIFNMEMASKYQKMDQSTRESLETEKSMVSESMHGPMPPTTKDSGSTTKQKALEFTNGQTGEDSKAAGQKTSCTVVVCIHGPTDEAMMESTSKTKSMGLECTFGQIKRSMRAIGIMESNMGKASLPILKGNQGQVCGRTVTVPNGCPIQ